MNELFAQLFGQSPSYANALFGEDEAARLRQQAQQQGLLNVGLSLLAGAGPSPQRRGVGELLAQGVMAGQQAYAGAYDKAVRDRMMQEQLAERQQARAEQQAAQALLPQILRPGAQTATFYGQPAQGGIRDEEGNLFPGVEMRVGQPQIDMNTLQRLLTQAPSVAGKILPTVEAFRKMNAPQEFDLAEGQVRYRVDPNTGQAMPVAGAAKTPKPTSDIQEYEKAVSQGFKGSLLDYQMAIRQAGATRLNVDTGGRAFEQKAGQFAAETFRDLANQGTTATRSAIQLDRLDTLLGKTGGGLATQAKAIAGNFGIETKNLSEIQAAEAIVNQLVPLQRPPGSGTMSDADLALFKRSLPRLINTPAGNKQIIDTLRAINQYDQQIGAIARDALRGKITPEEADARIMRVPNPLRRTLDEIIGG
jgi:flagellar protein FlgJ